MRITEFKNQILPLRDKLFRLALRITQNPAEAEDIVQEVMLRRWNCREEWTKIESKEAYCCTMNRKIVLFKSSAFQLLIAEGEYSQALIKDENNFIKGNQGDELLNIKDKGKVIKIFALAKTQKDIKQLFISILQEKK